MSCDDLISNRLVELSELQLTIYVVVTQVCLGAGALDTHLSTQTPTCNFVQISIQKYLLSTHAQSRKVIFSITRITANNYFSCKNVPKYLYNINCSDQLTFISSSNNVQYIVLS
jgi:hypothetical protein